MLCRFLPSFRNAIMALFVLLYHERVVCHNLTLSNSHSYIFFSLVKEILTERPDSENFCEIAIEDFAGLPVKKK